MNQHGQQHKAIVPGLGIHKEPQDQVPAADKMNLHLQDIDSKQKTLLTNIQNNFNNISQLNTINLQPLVASFINKNLSGSHHSSTMADAFDPRSSSPEPATGNKSDPTKDMKWDQNQ